MTNLSRDGRLTIAVLFACAAFWAVALFPGELTPDSVTQIQQGVSGVYSDAHPAALSWLLGRSMAWTGNTGLVILVPLALAALGLAGLVPTLPQTRRAHVVFLAFALFPPLWSALATVSKDAWTTALLLDAVALIAARRLLPATLAVAAMCLFRHNAITAVPALAAFVAWDNRDRKALAAFVVSAMLAGSFAAPRVLNRALDVQEGRAAAPSLVFDVTGVYAWRPEAFATGPFAARTTYDDILVRYEAKTARKFTSDRRGLPGFKHAEFLDDARYAELTGEWRRVITTWPGAWALHRAAFAGAYLSPIPFEAYGGTWKAAKRKYLVPDEDSIRWNIANVARIGAAPLGSGAFWTTALAFVGAVALKRRDALGVAVAAAAACGLAANLLIAPSSPFRYHLPSVVAVIVLAPRVRREETTP